MNYSNDTIPDSPIIGWPPDPPQQVIDITIDLQLQSNAGEDVPSVKFQWRDRANRIITMHWLPEREMVSQYGELIARRSTRVAR